MSGNSFSVRKKCVVFLLSFVLFFSSLLVISGQPPELHVLQGFVHHIDGSTQVPTGVVVRVNATDTGSFVEMQTFGPPGRTGFYSNNIYAVDYENITVTAFNATAFGRNFSVLTASPSVTPFNVTLNTTRPPEVDTSIIFPSNNSMVDKYEVFNVTFNVTAMGGQNSEGCNSTIVFGDEVMINITSGTNLTIVFGAITLGTNKSGYFEVEALSEGSTTITVSTVCSSDLENFENLYSETISVRVAQQAPQLHVVQGYIFHIDNVTQVSSGTNVTINATFTGSSVVVKTSGPPGHSGFYSTTISARDGELVEITAENETYSGNGTAYLYDNPGVTRVNVSLDTMKSVPFFSDVLVEDDLDFPVDEIDLTAAGNKTVNCSANVSDVSGYEDIINVTAVFFDSSEASANSSDDNNNHYTNDSCVLSNCASLSCDVDCIFEVRYYANSNLSDSWVCVLTGVDNSSAYGYGNDSTSINPLLAIEFPDIINFGTVDPNTVSGEVIANATNRGNIMIDVSIDGYGGADGDGYAMTCDNGFNISGGYEKYNLTASNPGVLSLSSFEGLYTNVTDLAVNETDFNLDYRRNDTFNWALNQTYWRIFLPPGSEEGVSCSGEINIGVIQDQG